MHYLDKPNAHTTHGDYLHHAVMVNIVEVWVQKPSLSILIKYMKSFNKGMTQTTEEQLNLCSLTIVQEKYSTRLST